MKRHIDCAGGEGLTALGPKLVPFFKAVLVYFVVLAGDDDLEARGPSWTGVLVKVLPILSLVLFVLLHEGLTLGLLGPECWFSRRVLLALALSALADALLVWPAHFLSGMAVFGVAHLLYIAAFGFRPLRPVLGLALYALSAWAVSFLVPSLTGPLALGVPLYALVLATMLWRAVASSRRPTAPWSGLCPRVGGLLFAASDALIGFHMFHRPIPHSQALIMATYYAAQLGMALSIVGRSGAEEDGLRVLPVRPG
ncbi:lysoplasmalogenase-like protein TMEM86A isoform X1 [Frankliniella occidentalis]|uniref:lysoplasmalogenase n=1 Tax=Frankliniella occidentalis TaxID=133901 RepID=A0A6J1SJ52_FRAOC|nr:lysoplasmalogenase-like protein TMEM86A isoform X1 [Frankliniella occidentalis]